MLLSTGDTTEERNGKTLDKGLYPVFEEFLNVSSQALTAGFLSPLFSV